MIGLPLLDLPPDLPPARTGIGVLIVLAIFILALVSALIVGFVWLLVWRKRARLLSSPTAARLSPAVRTSDKC